MKGIKLMDKKLKKLIEDRKLSDADLIKLIEASPASEEEPDEDESEEQPDSEEADSAEEAPAPQEKPKSKPKPAAPLSAADISKLVSESVLAAFKAEKELNLLPSQKSIEKKAAPKPKVRPSEQFGITGGFVTF